MKSTEKKNYNYSDHACPRGFYLVTGSDEGESGSVAR
jgi:hypothetical protein